MKKSLLITICILFVVTALCGCNHKDAKQADNTPTTAQSTESLTNKDTEKNVNPDVNTNDRLTESTESSDNKSDKTTDKVNQKINDISDSNKNDEATSALSDDCGEVEIDFSELE